MTSLVSVIIPNYNNSPYLCQCLDSVINQTLKDIEIICVDDGSTDESLSILQKYANTDSRIKVYQQKNKGGGAARNLGLSYATGKYVYFIDSDDYAEPVLLDTIVSTSERYNSEITIFGYNNYDSQTGITSHKTNGVLYSQVSQNRNVFTPIFFGEYAFDITNPAPWNKLFLREFIERMNLKFMEIKHSNDVYFTYASIGLAKKIAFVDSALYYYRININTNTGSSRYKNPTLIYSVMENIRKKLTGTEQWNQLEPAFVNLALNYIMQQLTLFQSHPDAFNELKRIVLSGGFDTLGISKHAKKDFHHHKFAYWEYQQLLSGNMHGTAFGKSQVQYYINGFGYFIQSFISNICATLRCRGIKFTLRYAVDYINDIIYVVRHHQY